MSGAAATVRHIRTFYITAKRATCEHSRQYIHPARSYTLAARCALYFRANEPYSLAASSLNCKRGRIIANRR